MKDRIKDVRSEIPFSHCTQCGGTVVVPSFSLGEVVPRYTCDCHGEDAGEVSEDRHLARLYERFEARVRDEQAFLQNQEEPLEEIVQGQLRLQMCLGDLSRAMLNGNLRGMLDRLVQLSAIVRLVVANDVDIRGELDEDLATAEDLVDGKP